MSDSGQILFLSNAENKNCPNLKKYSSIRPENYHQPGLPMNARVLLISS